MPEKEERLTKSDVESNANTTLDTTTDVVSVPGYSLGYIGIDARGEEKAAGIFDVRVVRGDQHDQSDEGGNAESDHENATSFQLVGSPTSGDTAEACHNVWWYGHQLGLIVGVTKSPYDGGKEERERIQWSILSMLVVSLFGHTQVF